MRIHAECQQLTEEEQDTDTLDIWQIHSKETIFHHNPYFTYEEIRHLKSCPYAKKEKQDADPSRYE